MQYCINLTPDYVSFFSFSDVVLSKPSVSGDKKLNALNSAEDELLLISSLNRLNDESFFEFAIQGNKFYANKIHKVFYSVCLYLMHCLVILISSLFFFFPDQHIRMKEESQEDAFVLTAHDVYFSFGQVYKFFSANL